MGKPEQKDIYWENCQSYGVNLSLGGCHLVDKESLANKSDGDNDHDDEAMMMMTAMVRKMMVMTSIEASFVSSEAAVGEIIIGTRLAHKFKQIFYHLDFFLQICDHFLYSDPLGFNVNSNRRDFAKTDCSQKRIFRLEIIK